MREHSFKEKLAAYTAMSAAFLAACHENAAAQIKYTDVIPDLVIDNTFFNLDLNNDGICDFKLSNENGSNNNFNTCSNACSIFVHRWGSAQVIIQNQNEICSSSYYYGLILPMNSGEIIGANNQFGDGVAFGIPKLNTYDFYGTAYCNGGSSAFSIFSGLMLQNAEKYLGLKYLSAGNIYYGWARVELGNNDVIILKDYAINTIPDSSIIAGNTGGGCSINNITNSPSGQYFLCSDSTDIQLFNSNNLNIQWMKNGDWLAGENDSIYTILQSGNYQALISDSTCSILVNAVQIKKSEIQIIDVCLGSVPCGNSAYAIVGGNTPANTYSYFWSNGSITQGISNVPPGSYQIIATTSVCMVSDTFNVILTNQGGYTISETHIDSACGNNGSIDVSIFGGIPPFSYLWNSGETTQDLTNLSTGVYQVNVSDANGCLRTLTVGINNIQFPSLFLTQVSDSLFCFPTGSFNYSWFDSSGNLLSSSPLNYFVPTNSGNYSVQMSDSTCSSSDEIYFNLCNIFPAVVSSNGFIVGCDLDSVMITTAIQYPGAIYNWYNSSGLIVSNSNNYFLVDTAGSYWLVLQYSIENCMTTSNTISFMQAFYPSSNISVQGNILHSNSAQQYQWYLDGNPISGATIQNYTPIITGNYTVEGTNQYGCSTMSDPYYFQMVSVNPVDDVSEIQLLIDPKYLQVIFSNEKFIGSQLQLYNSTGELVNEMVATQKTEIINIESLAKGIYILNIRNGNEIKNYKIAIL